MTLYETVAALLFVAGCLSVIAWAYKRDLENFDRKYHKSDKHYRDKDHT
ncbi:MAG: hypothetical protein VW270_25550 [Candidatus Poseidoniales archaeon]|jgi:hypothetical protein